MKQDLTKIYDGADLSGATANVIYLPIVRAVTLEKASVRTDLAQSGAGVFSVKKNGAEITTVTIANGSKIGTVAGLSVALADGDEVTIDLVSGSVSSPVTLNLGIEDGQSGGTSLPAGDLNASTNKLEKIQNVSIDSLASVQGFSDTFDGTVTDTAKWHIVEAGTATAYEFPSSFYSQHDGYLQKVSDGSNRVFKSKSGFNFVDGSYIIFEIFDTLYGSDIKLGIVGKSGGENLYGFGNQSLFRMTNSALGYYKQVSGNLVANETILEASPSNYRYLRLRRSGNNLLYEYSLNGTAYTLGYTDTSPGLFASPVFIFIDAYYALYKLYAVTTNLGGSQLDDGTLLIYRSSTNSFKKITLTELKAALNALP